MCTIAILLDSVADAPLVIAANRDELYARPTDPPRRWTSGLVAGVDVTSGGTWLAVRADGRFAAVTNQRALSTPPLGLRSRGLAVLELAAATDPDAYVAQLDPTQYASMNLVWGDARGVSVAYTRQHGALEIERLDAGVHVLCNDRLGADGFPRGERLRAAILAATSGRPPMHAVTGVLEVALADHTRVALGDTPASHLSPEVARELTATCIHTSHYGTRSATILAAAPGRAVLYRHANGPPCVTPFEDRSNLW